LEAGTQGQRDKVTEWQSYKVEERGWLRVAWSYLQDDLARLVWCTGEHLAGELSLSQRENGTSPRGDTSLFEHL